MILRWCRLSAIAPHPFLVPVRHRENPYLFRYTVKKFLDSDKLEYKELVSRALPENGDLPEK